MLEVVEPGLLSTVQDGGRPGWAHLGVPPSGACDRLGLAVANILLGNAPSAAALELTLAGPTLAVREPAAAALGGADLGATIEEPGGRRAPFPSGSSRWLPAGSLLGFAGPVSGGARAYLSVPGGIDVPAVLGSASTCLPGRFGGLDGRSLRAGDRLTSRRRAGQELAGRAWPSNAPGSPPRVGAAIRLLPGPHAERFPAGAFERLLALEWTVSPRGDRVGVRLEPPAGVELRPLAEAGEMVSLPMTWGAVQLPPDGRPVILLADHRTIGGYPVIGVVPRIDHPLAGQLAPGDRVRFAPASVESAQSAWRQLQARLAAVAGQLGDDR